MMKKIMIAVVVCFSFTSACFAAEILDNIPSRYHGKYEIIQISVDNGKTYAKISNKVLASWVKFDAHTYTKTIYEQNLKTLKVKKVAIYTGTEVCGEPCRGTKEMMMVYLTNGEVLAAFTYAGLLDEFGALYIHHFPNAIVVGNERELIGTEKSRAEYSKRSTQILIVHHIAKSADARKKNK